MATLTPIVSSDDKGAHTSVAMFAANTRLYALGGDRALIVSGGQGTRINFAGGSTLTEPWFTVPAGQRMEVNIKDHDPISPGLQSFYLSPTGTSDVGVVWYTVG